MRSHSVWANLRSLALICHALSFGYALARLAMTPRVALPSLLHPNVAIMLRLRLPHARRHARRNSGGTIGIESLDFVPLI